MRPFTSTISIDEARTRLKDAVQPVVRTERISLSEAAQRVAAEDVLARIDVPPFARSAMDGYAVVAADTAGASDAQPARLRLVDRIYTGSVSSVQIAHGTCAEIATGAPLPPGADAVVMVEQTATEDEHVLIRATVTPAQHVGRQGGDIVAGDRVVRTGDLLTPARIGALAAIGCTGAVVYARPRVAILSTGNEVVEPGHPLGPGQIYDVNRSTLGAIVAMHGGAVEPHRVALDTVQALVAALDACADADVIVFSGGSSVGERDLVVDAVRQRGDMIFHGIAVKPGKPTAFARLGRAAFFGMPGNPTSCLSNAYILLVPYLRATARLPPYAPHVVEARLGRRIVSTAGRHQFYTVRLENGVAHPAFKGSGEITSLSQADGYIEIPADQSVVEEGQMVRVTLF